MAQVERYQTESHLTSLADDPTHPLSSAVPSRPGPELDSKFNRILPDPPQFVQPKHEEDSHSAPSKEDASETHIPQASPAGPVDHEFQSIPAESHIPIDKPEITDPAPLEEPLTLPHELGTESLSSEPAEAENSIEATPAGPTEGSSEMSKEVELDHLTSSTEDPQVEEPSAVEAKIADESVPESAETFTVLTEAPFNSQAKPREALENGTVYDNQRPASASGYARAASTERPHDENLTVSDDWTDLTKPEVQFAVCLFALPWTSLLVTSRTLNALWYLIFDWQLAQPVTGLLLSILAPSLVYTSLIAMFITLFAEAPQFF